MKITTTRKVTESVDVAGIRITLLAEEVENGEAYEDEGRFPEKYRQKDGEHYQFVIDANGFVRNWPQNCTVDAFFKPRDSGVYELLDVDGNVVAIRDGDYVPGCLSMGDGGDDYIELKINTDGDVAGFVQTFTPDEVGALTDQD